MTQVSLKPIQKDDRPTSHVRVGRSEIGGDTDVLRIKHRGREAYFRAEAEDDKLVSTIGEKAYINGNVADLFGGISYSDSFLVNADGSVEDVPAADSMTIHAAGVAKDVLEDHLRAEEAFVHRIQEVAEIRGSLVEFTVNEMSPSAHSTLRVTDDTDIEFTEEPAELTPAARSTDSKEGSSHLETEANEDDASELADGFPDERTGEQGHELGSVTDPADGMQEVTDEEFMEQIRETSEATGEVEQADEPSDGSTDDN